MFRRLFRSASLVLFSLALLAALGGRGGGCYFCSGSFCDDDDRCVDDDEDNDAGCDDDGNNSSATEGTDPSGELGTYIAPTGPLPPVETPPSVPDLPPAAYRLQDFELVTTDDVRRHPVAELRAVHGMNVFDLWGLTEYRSAEFAAFTSRLLDANPDLLGLPPGAGVLRFAETWFDDDLVAVTWIQTADHDLDAPWPTDDGRVRFLFDLLGNLRLVENATALPAGVARPHVER